MEQEEIKSDLSKIDFNEDRSYGFLKVEDKEEKNKKYKLLLKEAISRGEEKLFKKKVQELKGEDEPHNMYELSPKGTPLKIWENLKVLYDNKGIELKYNELKRSIESNKKWYMYEDFLTQINSDCRRTGLVLSKDDLWGFTSCIANMNAYNPIRQYLEYAHHKYKNSTQQSSELGKLLKTITYAKHCTKKDIAFNEAMILMWLLSGAKMGLNNGDFNSEFALVLKGPQGLGKTRWVRSLMPKKYLTTFFKDGVQLDLSKKDDIIQSTSYWLCELGELGGTMKKSDRDALKAWLTSTHDEFRTPYSRKAEKYPRRTFFACTVNDDQFLRDDTGSRRFVVLEVEKLDHNHTIDIDLMWGEVMELLQHKARTYMSSEEIKFNDMRNKAYIVKSDEQMLLEEYLPFGQPEEEWGYITSTDLCNYMQEVHSKAIKPRAVGKALSAMGYEQKRKQLKGDKNKLRYYKLPFLKGYSMPF